ncbi:MAG TPA: hypothetical protein VMV18_02455 [bacterium]|nr:hypothetical protein [bacterium]
MRRIVLGTVAAVLLAGCGAGAGKKSTALPSSVTIGIAPWTVQAGEDRIWCKTMKVPFDQTIDVSKFTIDMAPGSHHFILYRTTANLPDGFGDCPAMGNETFVVGSQNPGTFAFAYPQGLAMPLFAGEQLVLQSHYVNASNAAIQAKVDVTMDLIPHSEVTNYVETFLIPDTSFAIPPQTFGYTDGGKNQTETPGLNILSISSHMHKRGTLFTIAEIGATSSNNLFTTTTWDAPPIKVFDPPLVTDASKKLHYQCTWDNETTHTIHFGPTTEDEMCIMVVTVYPALDYAP